MIRFAVYSHLFCTVHLPSHKANNGFKNNLRTTYILCIIKLKGLLFAKSSSLPLCDTRDFSTHKAFSLLIRDGMIH